MTWASDKTGPVIHTYSTSTPSTTKQAEERVTERERLYVNVSTYKRRQDVRLVTEEV